MFDADANRSAIDRVEFGLSGADDESPLRECLPVCCIVRWRGAQSSNPASLDAPTMAHIHKGAPGVAGPPVVTLANPSTMKSEGCVDVSPELAGDIADHPANYYVNVHNTAHPDGAIRGQLRVPDIGK